MIERERSIDMISMSDVLVRERSFQRLPEGTFQNVPPTYDRLGYKMNRSDSIHTCSTVGSDVPLVGIKKSVRPNLKKICMGTLIVVNVCTIIGLIIALAVVSSEKNKENNSNCQGDEKTTASPLSVPDAETSTQMTTPKADLDTTSRPTEPVETTTSVEPVDTSTLSVSTITSNFTQEGNGQTTASPLSVLDGKTSTQMTTPKADIDTTLKPTEPVETTSVESVDTSTSSESTTTSNSTQGTWLTWGTWTECSATCGNGVYTRYRECNRPDDKSTECQGVYVQTEICIDIACAVYGKWTTWSTWASCDVTCDGGIQSRTRSCEKNDASDINCVGDNSQEQHCALWNCPDCSRVCLQGDLNPTCEICTCNTTRQGVVMTSDNETITNATVFVDMNSAIVVGYSDEFGSFSTNIVCDGASVHVEKPGYNLSACLISTARIICTITKNEKPVFIEHPQPKARLVGENVTLCCSAEGIPDIQYYEWMKGSRLVDESFYPEGTQLHLTDLTTSDSGVYRCRANSAAGGMMSEVANILIKDTQNGFCADALGQRLMHLPDDCVQPESMTASFETGFCNRQPCRRSTNSAANACREESKNCCTVADFDINTVNCLGYNLSVLSVKSCECGTCNFNTVKIVGTVLYYGTNEYVIFGQVHVNGVFSTYTNSKGSFSVSVNEAYGSAVITIISTNQHTTNVIDVSEGTTGTIYTNMYIIPETCSVQINANEDNIVEIGNCGNGIDTADAVAEMHISANSLTDDSLNIFNGLVKVSLTFLNATDISDLDIIPGLLLSVNEEGEKVPIMSLGVFRLRFYDSLTLVSLKLGKNLKLFHRETDLEQSFSVFELQQASGIFHEISDEYPAELNERNLKSWINIGQLVNTAKNCFFNVRIYEDPYLISEVTISKYQVFMQTIHILGSGSYETYGHTFSPSRTCFKTICDDNVGFIEVWISSFEKESDEYLMPANPTENVSIGLSFLQQQNVEYLVESRDPHLSLKFIVSSDGPFFENSYRCLSSTQMDNHFKFYFPDSVEDIFTLRHFFDLSTPNISALETVNQRVWYPKRHEGYRVCFVKVKFKYQTDENIKVRVISYGGTNKNISNEILGIRQTDPSSFIANCLEYKCSGTINEEFSDEDFDDTKVTVEYISSGSVKCNVTSFSQDLIDQFSDLNSPNFGENTFTFFAPTSYSPSFGIYSASTSSDDIQSARSSAKRECRSGSPMDLSSDNPDTGTAVVFSCV